MSVLERYAWVAEALRHAARLGIVYVLTVAETLRVSAFLTEQGLDVAPYSGQSQDREQLEDRLRDNQVKAVVATSALGHGLRQARPGVLHPPRLAQLARRLLPAGRPGRPRARRRGRGAGAGRVRRADLGVLRHRGHPRRAAGRAGARRPAAPRRSRCPTIESATGMRRGRLEGLLKILAVDDAVERRAGGWVATGKGWYYDEAKWSALRQVRAAEADLMRSYAARRGLPDAVPAAGARRPRPAPVRPLLGLHGPAAGARGPPVGGRGGRGPDVLPRPGRGRRAAQALAERRRAQGQDQLPGAGPGARLRRRPGLEQRARPAVARRRRGAARGPGRAASRCCGAGRRPGSVRSRSWRCRRDASRGWSPRWPSTWRGSGGCRWSTRSRSAARRPRSTPARPPGPRTCSSAPGSREGVSFDGPVLLVDDTIRSRWTLTVAGALLADVGATRVLPLALHQLP